MKSLRLDTSFNGHERGQAMAEFVILLTVLMILCSGMIYVSRLVTLQLWAQQEARLLAFGQTWAARSGEKLGLGHTKTLVEDDAAVRRPWVARTAEALREEGTNPERPGLADLYASANRRDTSARQAEPTSEGGVFGVSLAYAAKQVRRDSLTLENYSTEDSAQEKRERERVKIEEAIETLLVRTAFGSRCCSAMRSAATRHSRSPGLFDEESCPALINQGFSSHLANYFPFAKAFSAAGALVEQGNDVGIAVKTTFEHQLTEEFYSFFDDTVADSFGDAVGLLDSHELESLSHAQAINAAKADARYFGSVAVLEALDDAIYSISSWSSFNRDNEAERAVENALVEILHADAETEFPYAAFGISGFDLEVASMVPVPGLSTILPGVFDGLAYNVFSEEESSWAELIEESNIVAEVTYDASAVTWAGAQRLFGTKGRKLGAKMYLLTQPWHISRRSINTASLPFRSVGSEFDDMSLETEEAILRRRVFGLYVVPSELDKLLLPIADMASLFGATSFDAVRGAITSLSFVSDILKPIKRTALNSPLNDVFDAISKLPGINLNSLKLPEWPAVRPHVYPNTSELQNDRLSCAKDLPAQCSGRSFEDYIKEQKQHNPKPKPTFN